MFRIGKRAAVMANAMLVGLAMSAPAVADFKHQFPGKGSETAWHASWDIVREAGAAQSKKNYTTAEELYRKAIATYPYDSVEYFDLGLLLNLRQRYKDAEPILRKSVQLQPVFQNWHQLGISLAEQNKISEARDAFTQAEKLVQTERQREALSKDEAQLKELTGKGLK